MKKIQSIVSLTLLAMSGACWAGESVKVMQERDRAFLKRIEVYHEMRRVGEEKMIECVRSVNSRAEFEAQCSKVMKEETLKIMEARKQLALQGERQEIGLKKDPNLNPSEKELRRWESLEKKK